MGDFPVPIDCRKKGLEENFEDAKMLLLTTCSCTAALETDSSEASGRAPRSDSSFPGLGRRALWGMLNHPIQWGVSCTDQSLLNKNS